MLSFIRKREFGGDMIVNCRVFRWEGLDDCIWFLRVVGRLKD